MISYGFPLFSMGFGTGLPLWTSHVPRHRLAQATGQLTSTQRELQQLRQELPQLRHAAEQSKRAAAAGHSCNVFIETL